MFFYGTLMDRRRLAKVIGRRVASRELRPARLRDWRRQFARGTGGASVRGVMVAGLTTEQQACLGDYEGPRYQLEVVRIETQGGRR